jgi:hypothetical protein
MKQNEDASRTAAGHPDNGSVAQAFANQIDYCRTNGAPITARVVAAVAALLDEPGAGGFIERIRNWPKRPLGDALPLRAAGGLHALHLAGVAPELAPIYAGDRGDEPAHDRAVVAQVVRRHAQALLPWLDGPPQTNEAGRSWGFVAAMLWLAEQGLPPRFDCLEIGSSGGINLMLDRYAYDLGGVTVGPGAATLRLAPEWRGPPPPDQTIEILSLKGCDVAPIDLTDPVQALRLKAYTWPEHTVRFERLEAAVAAAAIKPPDIVEQNAADFIERQLAAPQAAATTRVLMHSVVWQYVPQDQQARIVAALEAHGARATPERALAWVELEADRTLLGHGLRVRYWPGGAEPRRLATAHAHGAWANWIG